MTTINEIKIESLTKELEQEKSHLEKYHYDIEKSVQDLVKYETNNKMRNAELAEYAGKIEELKNSIPDFSEETCALYVKYDEMKSEYESMVKIYGDINKRTEQIREKIDLNQEYISYKEKRIQLLKTELEETKAEE